MKKIRIMLDYMAECPFWDDESGVNLEWKNLIVKYPYNLTDELVSSFSNLTKLYDTLNHDENPKLLKSLNNILKELVKEVSRLNPRKEIIFYDEVEMKTYNVVMGKIEK